MGRFGKGLFFGGTEVIEPTGRDDRMLNGDSPSVNHFDDPDADDVISYENPHTGERGTKRAVSPSANGEQDIARVRVPGGKAAVPKRIAIDYDSDDCRIITLKQQGYSDEYVADKLIQEGRIRYVPKTVGSRWLRLRNALEKAEEERLDDELSDWHVGEDDILMQSSKIIEDKYDREIKKLMNRKWKEVAATLAGKLHKKKYTGNACRERLQGLQDGTAPVPIEIDDDQEGRKRLRETRIMEAKKRRAEQVANLNRAEGERRRRHAESKVENEEAAMKTLKRRSQKITDQAESGLLKREAAEQRVARREAQEAARAQIRAELDWDRTRLAAEKAIYARLTGGKRLPGAPAIPRKPRNSSGASRKNRVVADDIETDVSTLSDGDESEMSDRETDDEIYDLGSSSIDNNPASNESTLEKKKAAPATKPKVTKETLLNARSIMTDAELEVLFFERGITRRTTRETHPQAVARIISVDKALRTSELNDLLGKYFDKGKGTKAAKVQRLAEYEAGQSAAAAEGINASDLEFKRGYEGYKGEYGGLIEG